MKTSLHTTILAATTLALSLVFNSCDAVWEADASYGGPYNGYYGWDGEWLPALAGTPVFSPYYYGGTSFPIGYIRPVSRPGDNPWGGPANIAPARPVVKPVNPIVPPANGAIGNIRPGQPAGNNGPSILKPAPGASTFPNIRGSNPGIQLPPAGSGYRLAK